MLIKAAGDRERDVRVLNELLEHPAASKDVQARIQDEIRKIRGGAKGEAEAAYEIDFHFGPSRNWAVIHDLRLEWQGRVAQIDHLLIGRWLTIWACESKHFSQGVKINEEGEFTAFWGRVPYGVPSPLEQNRKHIIVLKDVLSSSLVQLPSRLGIPLRPSFESVVLISKGANITRPKPTVDGLDRVIKSDQLRSYIDRELEHRSTLASMAKLVSSETIEQLARQVAALNRPIEFDWHARFGLPVVPRGTPSPPAPRTAPPQVTTPQLPSTTTTDDPHEGRLSTSKFAAARGWKTGEALDKLVAVEYLEKQGDGHRLTDRGYQVGGRFVEKSRYGAYFLWPQDLALVGGNGTAA